MDPPPSEPLGTPSEPPGQPLSSSDSESARTTAQNAPSGASGTNYEAIPRPAQFELRTLEAIN
eukprot:7910799-Alexandrium_andersonii.AAC.1